VGEQRLERGELCGAALGFEGEQGVGERQVFVRGSVE
jgi:hypothetical protein